MNPSGTSLAGWFVTLALLAPALRADVLVVPDAFPTIQAALTAAGDGDEILIKAGTYTESLLPVSAKVGLAIRGQGQVVLRPTDHSSTTLSVVGGSDITVEKLTFEYGNPALSAVDVVGLSIRQCTFTKCGHSDVATGGAGSWGCHITSIRGETVVEGCSFETCDGQALHISTGQEGATLSVTDNDFETLQDGIFLTDLTQAQVRGNSVRCIGYDRAKVDLVGLASAANVWVIDCTSGNVIVEDNLLEGGRGVRIDGCDEILVAGNQIEDAAFNGIRLEDSTGVRVEGNTITNAGFYGIDVQDDCSSLEILDNVVKKARNVGMRIIGNALCKGNRIEQSSFDGVLIEGDDGTFLENVITKSGRVGLVLAASSESNTLTGNVVTGSRAYDLQDLAGGANLLTDNTIGTTAP